MPKESPIYEKSLEKTALLMKSGWLKKTTYFYHASFPNLRFYPRATDALQGIEAIINLITTDMSINPVTQLIQKALRFHGKLHVELVVHSGSTAHWSPHEKTISISNVDSFTPIKVIESFIFELCNATNRELQSIKFDSFDRSQEYAQALEEAESHTNNSTANILSELGVPTTRKAMDVKEQLELCHSTLALKDSNGFSHFDRYVFNHNEYLISKTQSQLTSTKFQLILSYLPAICFRRMRHHYDYLKDRWQKLNALLQEKYTLRDSLKEKTRKNLEASPYRPEELLNAQAMQIKLLREQLESLESKRRSETETILAPLKSTKTALNTFDTDTEEDSEKNKDSSFRRRGSHTLLLGIEDESEQNIMSSTYLQLGSKTNQRHLTQ